MEKPLMNSLQKNKVGFYPCCGEDILAPLEIMRGMVNRVIFCDKAKGNLPDQKAILDQVNIKSLPRPEIIIDDLRNVIPRLPEIHVFFYKGDSRKGEAAFILWEKTAPNLA
jgi:hypothetical protein